MENIPFTVTIYPMMDINGGGGKKDRGPHNYNTTKEALVDAHAKGWRVVVKTTRGTYYFKAHRDHWTDQDVREKIASGSSRIFTGSRPHPLFFFPE